MAVLSKSVPVATVSSPQQASSSSKRDEQMNVLVKWNQGKTLCLQVDQQTSVADLAVSIWQHAQRNAASTTSLSRDFCMVCRGKVLDTDDQRVLGEVVGAQLSLLHVQVWTRQRGGCFMVSLSILGVIMAAIVGSTCTCGLSLFIVPLLLPLLFILPLCCL